MFYSRWEAIIEVALYLTTIHHPEFIWRGTTIKAPPTGHGGTIQKCTSAIPCVFFGETRIVHVARNMCN